MRLNFNKITLLQDKIDRFSFIYSLIVNACTILIVVGLCLSPCRSVTVDLDLLLGSDALVDEELGDVTAVVTLELDDVSPLGVLVRVAIAAPRLFKVARQLTHIEILGQATHCSQALPCVSLLEMQMHEVVAGRSLCSATLSALLWLRVVEASLVVEDKLLVTLTFFRGHVLLSVVGFL